MKYNHCVWTVERDDIEEGPYAQGENPLNSRWLIPPPYAALIQMPVYR